MDVDAKMLGLVKPISVGINGDAKSAALALIERLAGRPLACIANKAERSRRIAAEKNAWEQELGNPFRRDALSKPVRYLEKYPAYT